VAGDGPANPPLRLLLHSSLCAVLRVRIWLLLVLVDICLQRVLVWVCFQLVVLLASFFRLASFLFSQQRWQQPIRVVKAAFAPRRWLRAFPCIWTDRHSNVDLDV